MIRVYVTQIAIQTAKLETNVKLLTCKADFANASLEVFSCDHFLNCLDLSGDSSSCRCGRCGSRFFIFHLLFNFFFFTGFAKTVGKVCDSFRANLTTEKQQRIGQQELWGKTVAHISPHSSDVPTAKIRRTNKSTDYLA